VQHLLPQSALQQSELLGSLAGVNRGSSALLSSAASSRDSVLLELARPAGVAGLSDDVIISRKSK